MAGSTQTGVPGRLSRADILSVYACARASIEGPTHIEAGREAVLWVIDPQDAEERAFRYRCVIASAPFKTGRMDVGRFANLYKDVWNQVNTIAQLIRPKQPATPKPTSVGRKKTT